MLTPTNATSGVERFRRNALVIAALWLGVVTSAVGVVYSTHLSRQLFNELNGLHRTTSELHVQWGQYLLEQSTWAAYSRVERVATQELDMKVPPVESIVMVKK